MFANTNEVSGGYFGLGFQSFQYKSLLQVSGTIDSFDHYLVIKTCQILGICSEIGQQSFRSNCGVLLGYQQEHNGQSSNYKAKSARRTKHAAKETRQSSLSAITAARRS
jgi:hypothetical protein